MQKSDKVILINKEAAAAHCIATKDFAVNSSCFSFVDIIDCLFQRSTFRVKDLWLSENQLRKCSGSRVRHAHSMNLCGGLHLPISFFMDHVANGRADGANVVSSSDETEEQE